MADHAESSIDIAADPTVVLDIISDFEKYPEWAGQVKSATVVAEDEDGWAEQVKFELDAGVVKDNYTLEYDYDIEEDGTGEMTWHLVEGGITKALDGTYLLTATDGGGTHVEYRLAVDLAIPMLRPIKRQAEKLIITTALRGLKKRAEEA